MTAVTMWWYEARFQLSRNSVRILLLLAAVLSAASVYLGHVEVRQQHTTIDQLTVLDVQERTHAWQQYSDWGDIAYYGFHYTYDRPSSLAFAALGQRDILPWQHRVRMLALEGQIYESDPTNPELAVLGRLDFALVASVLLPLLAIMLLHDVKAGERSAGRESLLLATATGAGLWGRRVWVLAALLGLCVLLPLWIGAAFNGTTVFALLAATLAVVLHLVFWSALVLWFARGDATAEVTACRLVGLWFVLAIAMPLLGRLAIIAATPLPESGEILMQQREVVNAAWDKPKAATMEPFTAANPEWREHATITAPFEWKWYYAFQQVGDEATAPLVARYRAGIVMREQAAWWLGLLSPPLLLNKTLTCLANTDLSAALAYEDAVREFHAAMRHFYYPLLFRDIPFDAGLLRDHPEFQERPAVCAF